MKKYAVISIIVLLICFSGSFLIYFFADHDLLPLKMEDVQVSFYVKDEKIYLEDTQFIVKGVIIGETLPGYFPTEYTVDKSVYLEWMQNICNLGANTIMINDIYQSAFYDALFEFNQKNDTPLYLIHGICPDDYGQFSHEDAYGKNYYSVLQEKGKLATDVIHGNSKFTLRKDASVETYRKDVSQWLLAYSFANPWDSTLIPYTNQMEDKKQHYVGKYLRTAEDATPYEALLARLGDEVISYETSRYKQQHLITFKSNPEQDPIPRKKVTEQLLAKCAWVDMNHIEVSELVKAGIFASFDVFYYDRYLSETSYNGNRDEIYDWMKDPGITDYRKYLFVLNDYCRYPVLVSAFGASTARGMWQEYQNEYHMTEEEQGKILISNYTDICAAGLSGGIVDSWQDEWYERTPNTLSGIDPERTPFWKDVQSSDQEYGLMAFEPGEEAVCTIDGDSSEWNTEDLVVEQDGKKLYMKQDSAYLYLLITDDRRKVETEKLCIPIDLTPKSGSIMAEGIKGSFERPADFILIIDGKSNSRVVVQKRYEFLRANFGHVVYNEDPYVNVPATDSDEFVLIRQYCGTENMVTGAVMDAANMEEIEEEGNLVIHTGETGKLVYGNGDPESENYNSLADFIFFDGGAEIRIPWNLLNFSDPSRKHIHDDYYENYGVEKLKIDSLFIGVGTPDGEGEIKMNQYDLKEWGNSLKYRERLKKSYYMLSQYWKE